MSCARSSKHGVRKVGSLPTNGELGNNRDKEPRRDGSMRMFLTTQSELGSPTLGYRALARNDPDLGR